MKLELLLGELESKSSDARAVALGALCRGCLPIIAGYFHSGMRRRYVDSVVGMSHEVDITLAERCLHAIEVDHGIPEPEVLASLWTEYTEPVTALQDGDLEIEDEAKASAA